MFAHLLPTGRRHMIACLRTADLRHCGCSRWCSTYPIYHFIHWSLKSMADGVYPERRHDHTPWRDTDQDRALLAGQA
eukprot:8231191-Pyramimonas_sp.AAC.1